VIDWTLLKAGTLAMKPNMEKFGRLEHHQVIKFFELVQLLIQTVDSRFGDKFLGLQREKVEYWPLVSSSFGHGVG
jgi:hypothetical protein